MRAAAGSRGAKPRACPRKMTRDGFLGGRGTCKDASVQSVDARLGGVKAVDSLAGLAHDEADIATVELDGEAMRHGLILSPLRSSGSQMNWV